MQSSSQLFPVVLLSAELRGDLTEDIYLLKPNNSPDSSVELALTRLGRAGERGTGVPVVLLHGAFANRRCWYSSHGHGLGAWLARAGFDVWLAEMRGHGLSPRNRAYRSNCVADYARYDLPAISAFVTEQCARPAHWLGHSLGGVSVAAALGGGHLPAGELASLVLIGSQARHLRGSLRLPPVNWGARLWLRGRERVSGRWLGLTPEDEPAGIARDALGRYGQFRHVGDRGENWLAALQVLDVPVLGLAGADDDIDPVQPCRELLESFGSSRRTFLRLGREEGFAEDYGHTGMLAGRHAAHEVWPLLEHWLRHGRLPEAAG